MSDYKEQELTGKSWQRANMVQIGNPHNGTPWVRFIEECITELSNGSIHTTSAGELVAEMTNPAQMIELVNPITLAPSGAYMALGEIQLALVSLYMQLAAQRDSGV
jgi:hypothetical protein